MTPVEKDSSGLPYWFFLAWALIGVDLYVRLFDAELTLRNAVVSLAGGFFGAFVVQAFGMGLVLVLTLAWGAIGPDREPPTSLLLYVSVILVLLLFYWLLGALPAVR